MDVWGLPMTDVLSDDGFPDSTGRSKRIDYLSSHRIIQKLTDANLTGYVHLIYELLDCSLAYLSIIDQERTYYVQVEGMEPFVTRREVTPDFAVFEEREALVVRNLVRNWGLKDFNPTEWDWMGWGAVPLHSREQFFLGTVGVASKYPFSYSNEDLRCLHTTAWEIMQSIYEGRHGEDLVPDLLESSPGPKELTLFS